MLDTSEEKIKGKNLRFRQTRNIFLTTYVHRFSWVSIPSKPTNLCPNHFRILFSLIFNAEAAHIYWTCCFSYWINCTGHNKTHTFISLSPAVSLICCFGLSYVYRNAKISFERNDPMFTPYVITYTSEELNSKASLEFSTTWMPSSISASHWLSGNWGINQRPYKISSLFVCLFVFKFLWGRFSEKKIVLKYFASHRIY